MNSWNLMTNNAITDEQRKELADFVLNTDKFTQGKYVKEFENAWCEWQGCIFSVFVNSGSSANLLLVQAIKNIYGPGEWVSQAITWPTTITPVMQTE